MALTKQDLQALRQCDRATLIFKDGATIIRCVKELKKTGPFSDSIRTYDVTAADSRIADYEREYYHVSDDMALRYSCCESLNNYSTIPNAFTTAIQQLREGDELTIHWLAGNNNDWLRKADLHRDDIELHVTRGKKTMVFCVASIVSKDNASRVVRRRVVDSVA